MQSAELELTPGKERVGAVAGSYIYAGLLVLMPMLVVVAGGGCWCWLLVLVAGAGCWCWLLVRPGVTTE